jgi:peptidoglycan hydrolase CwlO-like protein
MQHMEAKQANFYHMISKNEAKIDKIASQLENQKKQMEKIERTMIHMLEHEIHIKC